MSRRLFPPHVTASGGSFWGGASSDQERGHWALILASKVAWL